MSEKELSLSLHIFRRAITIGRAIKNRGNELITKKSKEDKE